MKRKGSCFTNLTDGMLRKISYAERVLAESKHHQPGAPNDGFLLNTLKTLFTFRCLEMYSKQRYKICICSAILDELESFRSKLQGLVMIMSIQYFPENFRCNLNTKVRHFPISLSIAFLGPKQILGFLFLIKKIA